MESVPERWDLSSQFCAWSVPPSRCCSSASLLGLARHRCFTSGLSSANFERVWKHLHIGEIWIKPILASLVQKIQGGHCGCTLWILWKEIHFCLSYRAYPKFEPCCLNLRQGTDYAWWFSVTPQCNELYLATQVWCVAFSDVYMCCTLQFSKYYQHLTISHWLQCKHLQLDAISEKGAPFVQEQCPSTWPITLYL